MCQASELDHEALATDDEEDSRPPSDERYAGPDPEDDQKGDRSDEDQGT